MNQSQQNIQNFILSNVKDGKRDRAQALLDEAFVKQNEGQLSKRYLTSLAPQMLPLLKPEALAEVTKIGNQLIQNS